MALKIRLSRGGAKKRPFYHVVIADSRSPRDGKFIERVGTYNPMVAKDHAERLTLKEERIKYWMGVGALPTDRVARFFASAGLMEAPTRFEQTTQQLPKAKALERVKENAEAAIAKAEAAEAAKVEAAEAAKAAAEAPAPVEEAPAEEAAAEEAPAEAAAEEAPVEAAAEEAPAEEAAAEEEKTDG